MKKEIEKALIKKIKSLGYNPSDVVLTQYQVEEFMKTGKLDIALGRKKETNESSMLPKNYKQFGENTLGERNGSGGSPAEW